MSPVIERFRRATFKEKLTWVTVLVTTTALVVAALAFASYQFIASRRAIVRNLSVQAATIGLNSASALVFNDTQSAEEGLAALRADGNIISAAIYLSDGTRFASYVSPREPRPSVPESIATNRSDAVEFDRRTAQAYRSIVSSGKRIGTVYLVYGLDALFADLARYFAITVLVVVATGLTALVAATRLQRTFSEPISRLATAASAVSTSNDYSVRCLPSANKDELGVLIDTFNQMLEQIQVRDRAVEAGALRFQKLNEELEHRVADRTAELQAINKELEAFTYSVSHDLRAPLRRIDGFANLLSTTCGPQLTEEGAHFLRRVRDGAQQMGHLVDDLLNLARLGRRDVTVRATSMSAIVDRVTETLKKDTDGRAIDWRLAPLPTVDCDAALIEVVFTNLLSNAVKYSRPRNPATIEVGTLPESNGKPVFFVRDNGVGFNMKYVDKLFGAFQRLHRPDEFEGTGIGLATVQRIIHKHNGSIWVEAEPDKGATFYFTLGAPRPSAAARA